MKRIQKYHPFVYFFVTIIITWALLFTAAYVSYQESLLQYRNIFILISLFTPFIVSMLMLFAAPDSRKMKLGKDFWSRLTNPKLVKTKYWVYMLLIMPITLILATAISLFFGQPVTQFQISPEFTLLGSETLVMLIILVLAPTFEELGWRGYGVDSLKQGRSIYQTTWLYILLWNLWHLPLFFIDGYYQNELYHEGLIYALNFAVSLIPASFLMNWLYFKNDRSILALIFFHVMLNLFSVLLQTQSFTKCIITILLSVLTFIIISRDKNSFLERQMPKSRIHSKGYSKFLIIWVGQFLSVIGTGLTTFFIRSICLSINRLCL